MRKIYTIFEMVPPPTPPWIVKFSSWKALKRLPYPRNKEFIAKYGFAVHEWGDVTDHLEQ